MKGKLSKRIKHNQRLFVIISIFWKVFINMILPQYFCNCLTEFSYNVAKSWITQTSEFGYCVDIAASLPKRYKQNANLCSEKIGSSVLVSLISRCCIFSLYKQMCLELPRFFSKSFISVCIPNCFPPAAVSFKSYATCSWLFV